MSKKKLIAIQSYACFSALGADSQQTIAAYTSGKPNFSTLTLNEIDFPVARFDPAAELKIAAAENILHGFKHFDKTTRAAIACAKQALENVAIETQKNIIVNIGSSRGATHNWEKFYTEFNEHKRLSPKASPLTTLGNISSYTAAALKVNGFCIDHSITCGTGLQAIANSVAWLQSGMADAALAGASEAPLTPFSLAQMDAIGIYSKYNDEFPCKAAYSGKDKKNTMVLGEGTALFYLKPIENNEASGTSTIVIESIGTGNEYISSPTAVSTGGDALKSAMKQALAGMLEPSLPDCVVLHAPGTIQGDESEWNALKFVFGNSIPATTCNKWITGHCLGSSGLLSVEMAILMLQNQTFFKIPYPAYQNKMPKKLNKIMVNAQGFGGNAISVIVSKHN
jgi:3-oxoacyl-(acyl-carrier-protein) synthase